MVLLTLLHHTGGELRATFERAHRAWSWRRGGNAEMRGPTRMAFTGRYFGTFVPGIPTTITGTETGYHNFQIVTTVVEVPCPAGS